MATVALVPIAMTTVAWETLLSNAAEALGRSVSASLDDKGIWPGELAAFPMMVAEFAKPGTDPVSVLRTDRTSLKHLFFTFMLAAPSECTFALSGLGLSVTKADKFDYAIVSGRLSEWFHAIRDGLTSAAGPEMKKLLCGVVYFFERAGLGEVWGELQKHHTSDGLYFMVPK